MLKNLLFPLLPSLSRFFPLPSLLKWTGQPIFLPYYHSIGTGLPHIRHLYPLRPETVFRQDLDYLLRYFEPIGLERLLEIVQKKEKLKRPVFWLSFDDGLREVYEIARPILLEKGIPATLFLNPDFVDNRDLMFRYKTSLLIETWKSDELEEKEREQGTALLQDHHAFSQSLPYSLLQIRFAKQNILDQLADLWGVNWHAFLSDQRPYLTTDQIRQMQQEGFTIGAHSLDHRRYYDWPLEEQLRQTQESMAWVDQHFSPSIRTFAFPFTDHLVSRAFFEEVLGEKNGLDLTFGGAGLKQDISPYHLQRFPMETSSRPAQQIIPTEYLYYLLKAPLGKNRIQRQ